MYTILPLPPSRLADVVYPNGRAVGYNYASGVDAVMSRLSSIFDDSDADGVLDSGETVDAAFKYLGLGQIVEEDDLGCVLIYLETPNGASGEKKVTATKIDKIGVLW